MRKDNENRAARARHALRAYVAKGYSNPAAARTELRDDFFGAVVDLLTDLRHECTRKGWAAMEWDSAVWQAGDHFRTEHAQEDKTKCPCPECVECRRQRGE